MLEFRILGPLEVADDGQALSLGGAKQRALLAVLLLHRGETVSTDRLIDDLWGERAPASALKSVQVYVSHLRKLVGPEALLTQGRGYRLAVSPEQVDAERFEELAAAGRRALEAGDAERGSRTLREALALWRGPALADLAYEAFAQADVRRLDEARLGAVEDRADADLALGRHQQLVGELEALVREHPLRERLQGQLMLALYRSGRQADALDRFREARGALRDELGLEPGPELRELERAILDHDPELKAPPRPAPPVAALRRRRAGALLLATGGAALAAVVVAAALSESDGSSVDVAPNSVAVVALDSNEVVDDVPVGSDPGVVDADPDAVWVVNTGDATVSQLDPESRELAATVAPSTAVSGMAADEKGVWASNVRKGVVARIDPALRRVDRTVRLGPVAVFGSDVGPVATGAASVWAGTANGSIARIDPERLTLEDTIIVGNEPSAIAVGEHGVWVADDLDDTVTRIDPATGGVIATIPVGLRPGAIAVGAGSIWVTQPFDDSIARIDPHTNAVADSVAVGKAPAGVTVGAGSVWSANSGDGTVSRIDPGSGEVTATIATGGSPQSLAVAGDDLWVSVQPSPVSGAGEGGDAGTLRIYPDSRTVTAGLPATDPALAVASPVANATCGLLLNHPDEPFPANEQLQPEIAASMPQVSDGGRAYTYEVRDGFRFSPPSGAPVTAAAFRRAIERGLDPRMSSFAAKLMGDIVGFGPYQRGETKHLEGVTVSGNSLTIRLTAPSPTLPARLATQLFCAIPPSTPVDPAGIDSIPSAGPYYVESASRQRGLVLLRNPGYGGERPSTFDEIDVLPRIEPASAIAKIEAGDADVVDLVPDEPGTARIEAKYGPGASLGEEGTPRYLPAPNPAVDYLALNNRRPLFSEPQMRRAVNFAIDRKALAPPFPGVGGQPTDQYIPPGMPGFEDVHAYPLGAPDLAKAKGLAGAEGGTAVMYTCNTEMCRRSAEVVRSNLAPLGITVRIRQFPNSVLFSRLIEPAKADAPGGWDIAQSAWFADYLDPYDSINVLFEDVPGLANGNFNLSGFDDPAFQRRLRATAARTGPERYPAYARLDADLTREAAPVAAYASQTTNYFFSDRIGCQLVQAAYGLDLPALCLSQ